MKYILIDQTGEREVGKDEVTRILRDFQPHQRPGLRRQLHAGESLRDQWGYVLRRKTLPWRSVA